MLDVLALISQLKDFVKEEKGTFLSLFVMTLIALFTSSAIDTALQSSKIPYKFSHILIGFLVLIAAYWLNSRRLGISRQRTNISIAHMEVNNLDPKDQLTGEQKLHISNEIMLFMYRNLQDQRQTLQLSKYLNFIRLPQRIHVGYDNNETVAGRIHSEVLIWGILRYDRGKIFFHPKYEFAKSLNSELFQKLTHDIQSSKEVEYLSDEDANLGMKRIIHMVTYIGTLFHTLKLQNHEKYAEAKSLMDTALDNLDTLYDDEGDQSVQRGDQGVLIIESQLLYVKAKILHNWAQHELQDFDDRNQALDLLSEAGKALERKGDIIQKYFKSELKSSDTVLEHSYMYAVSLLADANEESEIKTIVAKLEKMNLDPSKISLTKKLIAVRFKDKQEALKIYRGILADDPNNTVALRSLGMEEYNLRQFKQSYQLLTKLEAVSPRHIFHDEIYDLKLQSRLAKTALRLGRLVAAVKHTRRLIEYARFNHDVFTQKYIL